MQAHTTEHPNGTILSMNTSPTNTFDVILLVPSPTSQKIAIAKELKEFLNAQYVYKGVTVSHGIFFLVLLQETKEENAMINICEQMGWSFDKILVITEANCLNGDILNRITDGKRESDDGAFVPHLVLSTLLFKMGEKMLSMMRETGRKMSEGMKRANADITVLEERENMASWRLEECRTVISMLQSALSQMVEERAQETAPIWFSPPHEQLAGGEVSMMLEIENLKGEVETLKRERAEEREYYDQKETIQCMDFNAHMNKTCAAYEEEIRKLKEEVLSPSVKELTKAIEYIDRKHQIMDENMREEDEEFRALLREFHETKHEHYEAINEVINNITKGGVQSNNELSEWYMGDINPTPQQLQIKKMAHMVNTLHSTVNTLKAEMEEFQYPGAHTHSETTRFLRDAGAMEMPAPKRSKISLLCDEVL